MVPRWHGVVHPPVRRKDAPEKDELMTLSDLGALTHIQQMLSFCKKCKEILKSIKLDNKNKVKYIYRAYELNKTWGSI